MDLAEIRVAYTLMPLKRFKFQISDYYCPG
jgi:hypothetical protein